MLDVDNPTPTESRQSPGKLPGITKSARTSKQGYNLTCSRARLITSAGLID